MTDELLDPVAEAGECDLVEALACPLPAHVVSEMLGVPVDDRDWLRSLMSDVSALLEQNLRPWERVQAEASEAKVYEYLHHLIDCKRAEPGDDLLSGLVAASDSGDRITQQQIVSTVSHIYGAGFRTTMSLIGNMVHTLMRHPDQLARLRADRSLVPSAVDEVLRLEPPVQVDARYVHADAEIGGQAMPKGHRVLLMLAAANRDPAVVENPDRFDVGRADVPTLAFGSGHPLLPWGGVGPPRGPSGARDAAGPLRHLDAPRRQSSLAAAPGHPQELVQPPRRVLIGLIAAYCCPVKRSRPTRCAGERRTAVQDHHRSGCDRRPVPAAAGAAADGAGAQARIRGLLDLDPLRGLPGCPPGPAAGQSRAGGPRARADLGQLARSGRPPLAALVEPAGPHSHPVAGEPGVHAAPGGAPASLGAGHDRGAARSGG